MAYLKAMLPSWNGTTGREVILNLLAYTPIGPYEGSHPVT
jgi:centromere protein I